MGKTRRRARARGAQKPRGLFRRTKPRRLGESLEVETVRRPHEYTKSSYASIVRRCACDRQVNRHEYLDSRGYLPCKFSRKGRIQAESSGPRDIPKAPTNVPSFLSIAASDRRGDFGPLLRCIKTGTRSELITAVTVNLPT